MKKNKLLLGLSAVSIFVALSIVAAVAAASNRPSANGHGNLTVGGELRTFSFHANTAKNGTVSGSATVNNRSADIATQISIDCLSVVGNMATMTGRITRSTGGPVVGSPVFFRVIDNGEGSNATEDQISLVAVTGPTIDCTSSLNLAVFPIEGGNIQVKP